MRNFKLLLILVFLLIGGGCQYLQKTDIVPRSPKEDTIETLLSDAKEMLGKAQRAFSDGKIEEGRELLDDAVNVFIDAPEEIKSEVKYREYFTLIVNKAADIEDSIEEGNNSDLLIGNTPLPSITRKEAQKIKEEVEEESKKIKYGIPVVINDYVTKFIKVYTGKRKESLEIGIKRSGKYLPMILKILKKYELPEELSVLPLLESNYKIKAVSRARAKGLWQFMRGTALLFGLRANWWIDERYNPEKATEAAAKLLKHLYKKYNDWYLALAAYDAGEGKVDRALRRVRGNTFWDLQRTRHLKRETKNYIPAFIALVIITKDPERFNIKVDRDPPLRYKKIVVPSPIDLRIAAKRLGISYYTLKQYNPELLRPITPYFLRRYELKVPPSIPDEKVFSLKKLPVKKRIKWIEHRIRRGESLYYIARKYGVSVSSIKSYNNLRSNLIRPGRILLIPAPGTVSYGTRTKRKNRIVYKKLNKKSFFYKVKKGDTLYKISREYNIPVKKIKQWNHLRGNRIFPGDKLIIYRG